MLALRRNFGFSQIRISEEAPVIFLEISTDPLTRPPAVAPHLLCLVSQPAVNDPRPDTTLSNFLIIDIPKDHLQMLTVSLIVFGD